MFYSVMNNDEQNGCVDPHTKESIFRSLSRLHITWQVAVVIFGVRRVRFKIYMYTNIVLTVHDAIIILLEVMYWIYH